MESQLYTVIIPALAGLIAGAISSLIAPWVHWGIEKRKLKLKAREELIREAREALESGEYSNQQFRHLAIYSRIRRFLSERAIKAVEGKLSENGKGRTEVVLIVAGQGRHSGVNPYRAILLDELTQLEKRWGLL
jgi:hypothetical protein